MFQQIKKQRIVEPDESINRIVDDFVLIHLRVSVFFFGGHTEPAALSFMLRKNTMTAQQISILWADDEIDLLKAQVLFLSSKGYRIVAVGSGTEALQKVREETFDLVFLDEHMPGLTGLEVLPRIKAVRPQLPVVMITKNEEENLMEEAIGSQIADYLIKPVNPNQILLSIKKILDQKRLVGEKTTSEYQQDFRNLGLAFNDDLTPLRIS